ncbi:hypothetical protein CPB83DRAFT_894423 [Crepidotus variabilis]|uniref:Uncharacterized protein n=1 Tax=Crepidotus variabilis TaxID=179855 RepID=A0A9P6EGC6_9AGAR|nr:hypothetical protein CPB83DRAFT_894423 [Crepidotus variabilis]
MNPTAPLLFLPHDAAHVLVLTQYIKAGSFSILLWDILNSVSADFRVVFRRKFNFLRWFSSWQVVVMNSLLYTVGEVENCYLQFMIGNGFFTLNRACTTLLFYARVTAVYARHRHTKLGFRILWLLTTAASSISLFDGTAYHLGPTRHCLVRFTRRYLLVIITAGEAVYDTIICMAITYQMHRDNLDEESSRSRRWGWHLNRDRAQARIGRFSQIFVLDSQLYFLITVFVKLPEIALIIVFASGEPSVSVAQVALSWPDFIITNIVAAKIYRNMKLGRQGLLPGPVATTLPGLTNLDHLNSTQNTFSHSHEEVPG